MPGLCLLLVQSRGPPPLYGSSNQEACLSPQPFPSSLPTLLGWEAPRWGDTTLRRRYSRTRDDCLGVAVPWTLRNHGGGTLPRLQKCRRSGGQGQASRAHSDRAPWRPASTRHNRSQGRPRSTATETRWARLGTCPAPPIRPWLPVLDVTNAILRSKLRSVTARSPREGWAVSPRSKVLTEAVGLALFTASHLTALKQQCHLAMSHQCP